MFRWRRKKNQQSIRQDEPTDFFAISCPDLKSRRGRLAQLCEDDPIVMMMSIYFTHFMTFCHLLINKHYIFHVYVFIWFFDYIIVDPFFAYNIRYIDLLTVTLLKNSITKSQFLNFEIPVQDLGKYNHRENGGPLGMVPLITPYTPYIDLHSGYLLGISPFEVTMYNHPGVAAFSP